MNIRCMIPRILAGMVVTASPAFAQGLQSPEAIEKIIGSEVKEEKASAKADLARLVAAIVNTPRTVETVRKTSSLEQVDIVFLEDAADGPPPEVASKLEVHKAEVNALRKELEGNAMLFHAIDSRSVLMRDVLAVEFEGSQKAVIYAAARQR